MILRARLNGVAAGAKFGPKVGSAAVAIADFLFGPESVMTKAGQKVVWTNSDDSLHQVALTGKGTHTAVMLKGQSLDLLFDGPGTYDCICGLHPNMKRRVEVK